MHKPSSGQSFSIAALLTHQNQLFAGGSFESIGSSAANNVAGLDGGFWRTLSPGTGVPVGALSLASIGMDLYVGGNFAQAALGSLNPLSSGGIARWQGNQWGILGDGFAAGTDGSMRAMASFNGDIFAAGNFTTAGGFGDPIRNIARFDGSRWHPLATPPGSAPIGEVRGLATFRGQLYVITYTVGAAGLIQSLARWDGALLQPFGPQFRGTFVNAIVVHADRLYVGGRFDQVGDVAASAMVAFDGSSWRPLGAPGARDIQGEVLALASAGDSLLIGGRFAVADGQVSSNAVRYFPNPAGQ